MGSEIARTFEELVELNYQLYNSLFLTLPLDAVEQAGILLPLLEQACREGFENGSDPAEIIEDFFATHRPDFSEREQIPFLFKIIQYVERQIVLIDALEDAAYSKIHGTGGRSIVSNLVERAKADNRGQDLAGLLEHFGVRIVLTAHPTQFYPGQVLAIISDLSAAISRNAIAETRDLLQQLGRTPFYQKQKPSPYDEAVLLTWFLANTLYPATGELLDKLGESYPAQASSNASLISIGFWPGGDRDGNPFVTVETTVRVAAKLRYTAINCYHQDLRRLKRRLSFSGVYEKLDQLEKLLHAELSQTNHSHRMDLSFFLQELDAVEELLTSRHQGLFLDKLVSFKRKVMLFGFHFASIDIRQDSRVIGRTLEAVMASNPGLAPGNLEEGSTKEQIDRLLSMRGHVSPEDFDEPVVRDTLASFSAMRDIQMANGERAAHRYIISNCRGPVDIARVVALLRLSGWEDIPLTVDVVPLFETIEDLRCAAESMSAIYDNPLYKAHLAERLNQQTVMLGFSDGTKDGGYLMANWAIYSARESITAASRACGVEVLFFDGRGGPPARGGGNTYLFYASMSKRIENAQIQMTVQGQTISSHYGIRESALHNLSLLLAAGLENNLYHRPERELEPDQRELIQTLSRQSYEKYEEFKQDPLFIPYLEERSTLKYYSMANIGSRPAKRGADEQLKFEDLRAIPFVGAWAQLKQNVPGFYGLGTALAEQEAAGRLDECIELYQRSVFFRALIANSMQSMAKTNFELTRYMENDPRFGDFWRRIHSEFELSKAMVLKVSGQQQLLEDNPRSRLSIRLREDVVLPLLTIQQYALIRIQRARETGDDDCLERYEKMVMRSLFGNINASRNSA